MQSVQAHALSLHFTTTVRLLISLYILVPYVHTVNTLLRSNLGGEGVGRAAEGRWEEEGQEEDTGHEGSPGLGAR